jgi:hypothetical protein
MAIPTECPTCHKKSSAVEISPNEMVVSRTLLHELELRLQEQALKQLARLVALLRSGERESSAPIEPFRSPYRRTKADRAETKRK